MVCLCGLTSPKNFDKESAQRSIGQSDTFNIRRACGLIRQDPARGERYYSAHRRRQEETAGRFQQLAKKMIELAGKETIDSELVMQASKELMLG